MQSVRQGQLAVAAARGAWMQAVPTTHLLDENEWYSFEDERNDEHMVRKAGKSWTAERIPHLRRRYGEGESSYRYRVTIAMCWVDSCNAGCIRATLTVLNRRTRTYAAWRKSPSDSRTIVSHSHRRLLKPEGA